MKRPSISTGTGDNGSTGLLSGGRVRKTHPQIQAAGDCDELNAAIGLALAWNTNPERRAILEAIQQDLIQIMGDITSKQNTTPQKIQKSQLEPTPERIAEIEADGVRIEATLPPLKDWHMPGPPPEAAALHLARTICRRCERSVLAIEPTASQGTRLYLNRLSDLFWLLSRQASLPTEP